MKWFTIIYKNEITGLKISIAQLTNEKAFKNQSIKEKDCKINTLQNEKDNYSTQNKELQNMVKSLQLKESESMNNTKYDENVIPFSMSSSIFISITGAPKLLKQ